MIPVHGRKYNLHVSIWYVHTVFIYQLLSCRTEEVYSFTSIPDILIIVFSAHNLIIWAWFYFTSITFVKVGPLRHVFYSSGNLNCMLYRLAQEVIVCSNESPLLKPVLTSCMELHSFDTVLCIQHSDFSYLAISETLTKKGFVVHSYDIEQTLAVVDGFDELAFHLVSDVVLFPYLLIIIRWVYKHHFLHWQKNGRRR